MIPKVCVDLLQLAAFHLKNLISCFFASPKKGCAPSLQLKLMGTDDAHSGIAFLGNAI